MAWNVAVRAELGELLTKVLDTLGWVVQSLAWPMAAVVIVLLLRSEIRGLFRRLRRGTWAGAEFHFEEGVSELVSQRVDEEAAEAAAFPQAESTGEPQSSEPKAPPEPAPEDKPKTAETAEPEKGSQSDIALKRPIRAAKKSAWRPAAHPVYRRLKDLEKPQGRWETPYRFSDDLASLAMISPRAGIARAWSLLERELTRFSPNALSSALSLIPPAVTELLTSEELTRIVNLKSLASELSTTDAEPSYSAAFSFIELAEELRLKLRAHRQGQESSDDGTPP